MSLKEQIQYAEDKLAAALAAGDSAAVVSRYTKDARLMPNGAPTLTGRDKIAEFFQGAISQGIVAGKFTALEVEDFGDSATEIGAYELFAQTPNGERVSAETGRYFVQWKKIDGDWLLHRDMFNQDTPVA